MHWSSTISIRGDFIELLLVSYLLIIAAFFFLIYSIRTRSTLRLEKKSLGIPDGLILYSDLNIPASPLLSKNHRLIGKPDYIIQRENRLIPVEVKSGRGTYPHQSQVFQLAAYCQIIEDISGEFVSEGILVYNNITYTIPFNPKLRYELESIMKTMRNSLKSGVVQRNHHKAVRCQHCSMSHCCMNVIS